MLFKFFQAMLRWFPVLQAIIQKHRSSKAMLYRKVFNEVFSGVVRDPDAKGSLNNPLYIRHGNWALGFPENRINTYGTGFDKYTLVRVSVGTRRRFEILMGEQLHDSASPLHPSQRKRLKTLIGKVLYFDTAKVKALVLDVFNREDGASALPQVYVVMIVIPPECEDFTSVEIPTIQWELGAIRKKDLPITHILRERDAKRSLYRIRETVKNLDRPGAL